MKRDIYELKYIYNNIKNMLVINLCYKFDNLIISIR